MPKAIEFVSESGVKYPIAFTAGALVRFSRRTGKEAFSALAEIEATGSTETMAALVACAMEVGAKLEGNPTEFDTLEVADMLTVADLSKCIAMISQFMPKADVPGESVTVARKQ